MNAEAQRDAGQIGERGSAIPIRRVDAREQHAAYARGTRARPHLRGLREASVLEMRVTIEHDEKLLWSAS
jgi:hypothetical protein